MWRAGSICFPSSVWVWHRSAYLWAVRARWKFPLYRCGPQCLICWWMGNHGRSFLSFPHPLQSCYYNMYNIYLLIIMNTHTFYTISAWKLGVLLLLFSLSTPYFPLSFRETCKEQETQASPLQRRFNTSRLTCGPLRAGWIVLPSRCGPQCLICWRTENRGRFFLSFLHPLRSCVLLGIGLNRDFYIGTLPVLPLIDFGLWFCIVIERYLCSVGQGTTDPP